MKKHNPRTYRSGLELKFKTACLEEGFKDIKYEQDKLKYIVPESTHTYTPDFTVTKNVYIETKGLWTSDDRKKALLIRDQYPEISILYVFQRNNPLYKKSKTKYLDFCLKNNLDACLFSDKSHWVSFIKKGLGKSK